MADLLATYGLSAIVYFLEVALLVFLIYRGHWKRLTAVSLYVASVFTIDGIGRSYALLRYGLSSREYYYFYWLTDVILVLAAFLLVCALFQRACLHMDTMWRYIRLFLGSVFVLVFAISLLSLRRNYENLFSNFIIEFQQNLYFTCLVLLTLLYVLMQKIESTDDELTLLVSGMGIQFAGPAASLALLYLTPGQHYSRVLAPVVGTLCTMGMLLIWFYAVSQTPEAVAVHGLGRKDPELAEARAREA